MNLNDLLKSSGSHHVLQELAGLLQPEDRFYLVGGAVRDLLLGREVHDYDFASPEDPTTVARELARRLEGSWFWLDRERRQSRILVGRGGEEATLDFAPFRGPDLASDLKGRDFTVNAMAVPLVKISNLIDPLGGLDDLRHRRLRDCSPTVLGEDPLRVLRGVRFSLLLDLEPEVATLKRMRDASRLLIRTAPERIRDELARVLSDFPSGRIFPFLEDLGAVSVLFGPPRLETGLGMGMKLAEKMEEVLHKFESEAGESLRWAIDGRLDDGFSRRGFLKLVAFLRGYAPDEGSAEMGDRFRLSRKNRSILENLAGLSAERVAEAPLLPDHERSLALWAEDLGPDPASALIFSAALGVDTPAPVTFLSRILKSYSRLSSGGTVPPLVHGRWILENTAIPAGPDVGEALRRLRREEIAGRVTTPEEARNYLLKIEAEII